MNLPKRNSDEQVIIFANCCQHQQEDVDLGKENPAIRCLR